MWNDIKYRSFLATFLFSIVQMNAKLFLQICSYLCGTRRRVALICFIAHTRRWRILVRKRIRTRSKSCRRSPSSLKYRQSKPCRHRRSSSLSGRPKGWACSATGWLNDKWQAQSTYDNSITKHNSTVSASYAYSNLIVTEILVRPFDCTYLNLIMNYLIISIDLSGHWKNIP